VTTEVVTIEPGTYEQDYVGGLPSHLPKNVIAIRAATTVHERPGDWDGVVGIRNLETAYRLFVGVYPYATDHRRPPGFQPDVPVLLPAYDFSPEEGIGEFAAAAGGARYHWLPKFADYMTWFVTDSLRPKGGDLSDLIGKPEYPSVRFTPLRYWNVAATDVETFCSIATLDLPKGRCRPRRFDRVVRSFARRFGDNPLTLTFSGSGA
jgi:hypothetical protein